MCNKAVENYPHASEFLSECYKTRERFHRGVHRFFFVFDSIPDKYKTQEICNLAVSFYACFIVYCPYKYITQDMCDKVVDDAPAALKLIPN